MKGRTSQLAVPALPLHSKQCLQGTQRRGSSTTRSRAESVGVLSEDEVTKHILSRQNPLADYKASSLSICLFTSLSLSTGLPCTALALSHRKGIRKNPYLEQGAGPGEGRGRKAGQEGRCWALSRPCPAAPEEHWSDRPSSGCFLRQKKVRTQSHSSKW